MDNRTGDIRRIWKAALYSVAGIRAAWKNEAAFRQELLLCIVLVPAAFWIGENAVEYLLLIGTCLFVLVVELLNSAVEAVVDRIGADRHELSGRAKDMASAAVFLSLCLTALCWGLIIFENLVQS
ncbi:MAG: diacylglycerol kinase [Thiohalobacterales bacterium]|nr:diacylglycerol kinase [Thiohalobacterales bacterium]